MFRLLRYFSIMSFVIILVVSVLLGFFYRRIILQNLVELGEDKNVVLTQAFSNSLWPQFAPFVASVGELSPEVLREHLEIARLRQAVLALMQGLSVVKVKVYNLEGLTVFSTQASQIGENKSTNAGFRTARDGGVASELTHRKTFSAFEGTIEDRDVLSSYIPIRRGGLTGPIEGVFELYDDITPLLAYIERTQRRVVIAVISLLAALYTVLFYVVRHADRIIRRQHKALQEAHDTLEARVDERTAALVEANGRLQEEIAERKLIEIALTQARDAALQAVQLKSEFLDNMSHEIRTPMNGIMGMTALLLETPLTAEQQEYVDMAHVSTTNLLTLLNDILDFSKIEAGQVTLGTLDFSLHPVVQGVIDLLTHPAQAKHLKLAAYIADDVPTLVCGDPERLQQVLLNLVGNAIKFTEQGEVTVHVAKECETTTHTMVRFTVRDTGIGIAKMDQQRIFQAFVQADGSSTRQYGGTGLGLAMSKRLIELMKGAIGLESVPGQGSTFWFTLPCAKDSAEAMATFVDPQDAITAKHRLGQPAFAAPVMLDVTIAPAPCRPKAQVKLFDVLIVAQGLSAAVEHDPAILQDVPIVGNPQSHCRVLFGKEKTDAFLLVETSYNIEDFRDQLRRQAHRGLIEQDELGARHQRSAKHHHLLLTTGDIARLGLASLGQAWEIRVDHLQVTLDSRTPVLPRVCPC